MLDANKTLVREFYRAMNARDPDAVFAFYADGARIDVLMEGPFCGERAASREGLDQFYTMFVEIEFTIEALTAEGDRVAAEVHSTGRLADGSDYGNRYHNLFVIRDGNIALLREYPTGLAPA